MQMSHSHKLASILRSEHRQKQSKGQGKRKGKRTGNACVHVDVGLDVDVDVGVDVGVDIDVDVKNSPVARPHLRACLLLLLSRRHAGCFCCGFTHGVASAVLALLLLLLKSALQSLL